MGDLVSPFWSLGRPSWHLKGILGDHGGSMKDVGRFTVGYLAILEKCRDTISKAAPMTNSQLFWRLFPCRFLYSSFLRNLDSWGSENKRRVLEVVHFSDFPGMAFSPSQRSSRCCAFRMHWEQFLVFCCFGARPDMLKWVPGETDPRETGRC